MFNLSTMQPYNLQKLHDAYAKFTQDFILYLPRTSNLNQLAKYVQGDQRLEVCHYCMKGASKVSVCPELLRNY